MTRSGSMPTRVSESIRFALCAVATLSCLSALLGMWMALSGDGGFPTQYLDRTPFSSAAIPGLILGLVVGGTQAAAAWSLIQRRRTSLLLSGIAGCAMVIWIFAELAMILQYSALQSMFLGVGLAEIVMVFALLGIEPRVVASWKAA